MNKLLLLLVFSIGLFYANGQSYPSGVWAIENVKVKELNKSDTARTVTLESLASKLTFECPAEIDIQWEDVSVKLINGTTLKNISYILDDDYLEASLSPSKKSTYKIGFSANEIRLNQVIDSVEYTYTFKKKK